jgi:hypothetical protein
MLFLRLVDQIWVLELLHGSGVKDLFLESRVQLEFLYSGLRNLPFAGGILRLFEFLKQLLHLPVVLAQHLYGIRHTGELLSF